MSQDASHPAHLEPSQLGTRQYWDNYYQNDLDLAEDNDELLDPSELESWFDDVNAPAKVFEYLTSKDFPLSPVNGQGECSVLDLGMGNGGMLFSLRLEGGYSGPMLGLDYSQQSVDLARKLADHYLQQSHAADRNASPYASSAEEGKGDLKGTDTSRISFEKFDLIHEDPQSALWWPAEGNGFQLVLDKGTFDAVSLSSDTIECLGRTKRIHEVYPRKVADLVAPGGYFLITSCNWTEEELLAWFSQGAGLQDVMEVFAKIRYPVYSFGGQQGQGVVSICFRRKL